MVKLLRILDDKLGKYSIYWSYIKKYETIIRLHRKWHLEVSDPSTERSK